jgi:hypothetical protein
MIVVEPLIAVPLNVKVATPLALPLTVATVKDKSFA